MWIKALKVVFRTGAATRARNVPVFRTIEATAQSTEPGIIVKLRSLDLRNRERRHESGGDRLIPRPCNGHTAWTAGTSRAFIDQTKALPLRSDPNARTRTTTQNTGWFKYCLVWL